MVHVSHLMRVHVVALVTADLVKGVAMISVFHRSCAVMTHTAASVRNVVLIIGVIYKVNVVSLFTVHQT
jgi:hypothetical protein